MKTEINVHGFLLWTFVGFFTGAALLTSMLLLSFNSHPKEGRWVYECLQKKNAAVQQTQPKLVILSGSNSLFGFSAEQITKKFGIPAVNAAIHAGLGTSYILYYGKKYIAPSRIFILPLEYQLYGKASSSASGAYLYQVVGFDPEYFWNMSVVEKIKFTIGIPWGDLLSLLKQRFISPQKNDINDYQSTNLNAWGDETTNTLENRTEAIVAKLNAAAKAEKFVINEDVWNELAKFVQAVRDGGGDVVLTYPNIYTKYLDMQMNMDFFAELASRAKEIDVKLIGNPDAARYDESLLFDTQYHPNTIGQTKATERLYEDLHRAGII